jgi:hypothetical protein
LNEPNVVYEFRPAVESVGSGEGELSVGEPGGRIRLAQSAQGFTRLFAKLLEGWAGGQP